MSQDVTGTDPRVVRTRRDVVDAATAILRDQGWSAVTHGEVAKRAGYSKATVYTHWPTRLDLVGAAVTQICDSAGHPHPTGDLRGDLVRGLVDFADDLASGHLARVLGGAIERAGDDPVVDRLREQLYVAGTRSLDAVLRDHLAPVDVEPSLLLLVGGVLARASFQAGPIGEAFVEDLVDRVLAAVTLLNAD
ncbi:TetR family transcriptional regulator [Pseudonocardia hierapolitana]|uniref:TetR family transcriptional regulator n=1 Tax=Pseudonocardia hierapolitana TaxID=1128676 RepID=A0A561SJU4_9PSEU|nr:TetR/AcrR family transcriptional regulator [Pseudonocardia hierapolitana]TWF75104.1 TetR family transcriptional regulator [Pseudonocardia hierapolitana]